MAADGGVVGAVFHNPRAGGQVRGEEIQAIANDLCALQAELCRRDGQVEYEEYVPEGLAMTVILGARLLAETAEYIVEE